MRAPPPPETGTTYIDRNLLPMMMQSGDVIELYRFISFLHVGRTGRENIFKRWAEGALAG